MRRHRFEALPWSGISIDHGYVEETRLHKSDSPCSSKQTISSSMTIVSFTACFVTTMRKRLTPQANYLILLERADPELEAVTHAPASSSTSATRPFSLSALVHSSSCVYSPAGLDTVAESYVSQPQEGAASAFPILKSYHGIILHRP